MKTLVENLADVTLIDETSMSILTDDVNEEITSNKTMQLAPPGGQVSY